MPRLLDPRPLTAQQRDNQAVFLTGQAHTFLCKAGSEPSTVHALSGELYLSQSGWMLLDVPNALVRGAFDALDEPGAELPLNSRGQLVGHITVFSPEELKQIGGPDKVTERGHHFHYTLGPVREVTPKGWANMSKVWYIEALSPELHDLRKSYGLSPRPNDNEFDFHITIGRRRTNVLKHNSVVKLSSHVTLPAAVANLLRQHPATEHDAEIEAVELDDNHLKPTHSLSERLDKLTGRRRKPVTKVSEDKSRGLLEETSKGQDQGDAGEGGEHGRAGGEAEGLGGLPAVAQPNSYTCGPAALAAIEGWYKGRTPGIRALGDELGADPSGGTTPGDIAAVARAHGFNTDARPMTLDDLRQHIAQDHPVIVAYQNHGTPEDYKVLSSGHYSVVTGLDEKNIHFRDPSKGGNEDSLPLEEFEARWKDKDKHGRQYNQHGVAIWKQADIDAMQAPDERKKKEQRHHEMMQTLKTMIFPVGVAAGGGAALATQTATNLPVQVTRFPGNNRPFIIRGPVRPGGPASTIDDTNDAYVSVAPHTFIPSDGTAGIPDIRAHIHTPGQRELTSALAGALQPGQRLRLLELIGHGAPEGQQVGTGHARADWLQRDTVEDFARRLNTLPRTENGQILTGGCQVGDCTPSNNWAQPLADRTGMSVTGSNGISLGWYPAVTRTESSRNSWTTRRPNDTPVVSDNDPNKVTYTTNPESPLWNALYHSGRPASIISSVLAPLLSDERAALGTAAAGSALTLPMLLSEMNARAGESVGNQALGNTPLSVVDHAANQGKVLPYAALSALPMLSYGLAKWLGRWDDKKKDKQPVRK